MLPAVLRHRWQERLVLLAAFGILLFQVFIPPFIGIANNGDFSKVCMQFCLGPKDGWVNKWIYFDNEWVYGRQYCWGSQMRVTEFALTGVALKLSALDGAAEPFDIRWLGLVHSALLFGALFWFLRLVRPLGGSAQLALGALALWIFFDVRYLAYLNSFYMDTAAFLGLLLLVLAAAQLIRSPNWATLLLYGAAVVFFAMSKSQHGVNTWMAAALPIALMARLPSRAARVAAIAVAAVSVTAAILTFALTPPGYKGQALYNVVFLAILGNSSNVAADGAELGVAPEELRYAGSYAFAPGSPGRKLTWIHEFYKRTGHGKLLLFYLRHPDVVLRELFHDLHHATANMRSPKLGNYRREDGYPPGALAAHFGSWTTLRSTLFRWWPGHILLWFGALAGGAFMLWRRVPQWRLLAALALALVVAAACEFGIAALADAVETDRHLYIFHAVTDVTVTMAAVTAAALPRLRRLTHGEPLTGPGQKAY